MEDILTDLAEPPVRTAGIGIRFAAALLDNLVLSSIAIGMMLLWGNRNEEGGYELTGFPALILFGITFALIPLMEGLKGHTIGKYLCKIKVIKDDGSPTNVGLSFIRHFFDVVECIFFAGLFVARSNKKRRRIGDLVAGTRVVYQ